MISFDCECGEPLAAAPEHAGKQVKCPRCEKLLTVPRPEADFEYPADDDPPAPPPPRRGPAPPPKRGTPVDDPPKKAALADEPKKQRKKPAPRDEEPDHVRRLMERAHAELDADEAKRSREWRPVVFTPGLVGGTAVFIIFTLLAVLFLLIFQLYLAIGCLCFAVLGLARAVLSYLGQGID